MIPALATPAANTRIDRLLVGLVGLYVFGLFINDHTWIEKVGLYGSLALSLIGNRWRAALPILRHPLFILFLTWLGWLLATSLTGSDPAEHLASMRRSFKDYFLILPPLAFALGTPERRAELIRWLAWGGAGIVTLNGAQYLQEIFTDPSRLLDIKAHRAWSHPLVFFLPFLLAAARNTRGAALIAWSAAAAIAAFMIVATGARGAWLAMAGIFAAWAWLALTRRQIIAVAALGGALLVIAAAVLPGHLFVDRIQQGFSTTQRADGTWRPALDMTAERPLTGFGFGSKTFMAAFHARVDQHPEWTLKEMKGPHSNYFEIAFAGGYPAMIGLIAFFGATLVAGFRAAQHSADPASQLLALAGVTAFLGFYVTRGAFETVRWGPMIVPLLIVISAALASRRAPA